MDFQMAAVHSRGWDPVSKHGSPPSYHSDAGLHDMDNIEQQIAQAQQTIEQQERYLGQLRRGRALRREIEELQVQEPEADNRGARRRHDKASKIWYAIFLVLSLIYSIVNIALAATDYTPATPWHHRFVQSGLFVGLYNLLPTAGFGALAILHRNQTKDAKWIILIQVLVLVGTLVLQILLAKANPRNLYGE
ncbi:hypothetical protein PMZ80_009652 [Knufia obscura]|uniref:Uncharacterized protein n=2 Tax=Knufia TaxID=430999 RepID=A0AAN8EBJ3_9EURO|nr:hypothetical protein PMZ80_009652 [Knufia obscura]KAK5951063.1 hypothetical protein OHC33_007816 [Knufia fluminis]